MEGIVNSFSRRRNWTNLGFATLILFASTVASSCKKAGDNASQARPDTAATVPQMTAATPNGAPASAWTNPDSVKKSLLAQTWDDRPGHSDDGQLDCHVHTDCGGNGHVKIHIIPATNAYKLNHKTALDGTGPDGWIMKIINTSNDPYEPWKLLPHDVVFLYVGPAVGGGYKYSIYRDEPGSNPTLLAIAQAGAYCETDAHPGSSSAHLYDPPHCLNASDRKVLYGTPFPAPGEKQMMSHTSGLWISCSLGCCEASQFEAQ
jgi:hypothetical protein